MVFGGISGKVIAAEKQLSKYYGRLVNALKQNDAQLLEIKKSIEPVGFFAYFFFIYKLFHEINITCSNLHMHFSNKKQSTA